jgi:hypothetical protein
MLKSRFPATAVALVALFLAAGGASYAAVTINGTSLKNRSVPATKLKKHTLTGTEIDLSRLGKVPSAGNADTATNASHATNADNATHAAAATNATHAITADSAASTSVVSIHPTRIVDAAADFASAQPVPLGSKGPFSFYGKCYAAGNGHVEATTYIASMSSTGIFDTEAGRSGSLTPSTPEINRVTQDVTAVANSFAAGDHDKDFMATDGTTTIYGIVGLGAAKSGTPAEGNGPFGPGDRCMFGEVIIG